MVSKKKRKNVKSEPLASYFKPIGTTEKIPEEVLITVEEFEAVRLKDFSGLEQKKAAKRMGISQPTFHRLILSARKKIGTFLVEGKALRIEGGEYKVTRTEELQNKKPAGVFCVCPKCGQEEPKRAGLPCFAIRCYKCEVPMKKEERRD
jgi:predicted DNA-binding protein (UPF0251 family)